MPNVLIELTLLRMIDQESHCCYCARILSKSVVNMKSRKTRWHEPAAGGTTMLKSCC